MSGHPREVKDPVFESQTRQAVEWRNPHDSDAGSQGCGAKLAVQNEETAKKILDESLQRALEKRARSGQKRGEGKQKRFFKIRNARFEIPLRRRTKRGNS